MSVAWFDLTTGLVGGLALFLLGIQQLTRALQNATSGRLRSLLLEASRTPARGALSGALTAGVIQSSTATVVLIIGFVAAGAMALPQAVAVVLGANVGTTVTIQVIAFDVTRFALLMIAVGLAVTMVRRLEAAHPPARTTLALGLVFFGMHVMAGAVEPLREHPVVVELLSRQAGVAVGLLAGAALTALLQSSSATSGIVIVFAAQGLLDLHTGIAVLLGASIGHCVTPLLAGLGARRPGLRVALVHTIVNLVGVAVWIWLVPWLAQLAAAISPSYPQLTGTERLASETPRQLANAYTIFTLANLALFIGFTRPIARLLERVVPDREDTDPMGARYLDEDAVDTPDIALELVRRELGRLADAVVGIVDAAMPATLHGNAEQLEGLADRDRRIDAIYEDVVAYLGEVGQQELSDEQGRELFALLTIANDLESIGDVVEINLVALGMRRLTEGVLPSSPTTEVVAHLHRGVVDQLLNVRDALVEGDPRLAERALEVRAALSEQRHRARQHLTERLRADEPNRIRSYEREVEVIGHLQRISSLARRVAERVPAAGGRGRRALGDDPGPG